MKRALTPEQWNVLVRVILTIIGTLLVSRGIASQTQVDVLIDQITQAVPALSAAVGVLCTILPAIWGLFAQSRTAHLVAVKDMPAVDKILIRPAAAASEPDNPAVTLAKNVTEPKVVFAPVPPPPGAH